MNDGKKYSIITNPPLPEDVLHHPLYMTKTTLDQRVAEHKKLMDPNLLEP